MLLTCPVSEHVYRSSPGSRNDEIRRWSSFSQVYFFSGVYTYTHFY